MSNNKNPLNIIFLDVDGVLNCNTTKDICAGYLGIEDKKVSLLKKIVDASHAKIVLVSSWKLNWKKDPINKHRQDVFANYLDSKLSKQGLVVVDKTKDYNSPYRGDGIRVYLDYLKRFGLDVNKFVILDDQMFDYRKMKLIDHLVKTTPSKGLQISHVRKAIEKLC